MSAERPTDPTLLAYWLMAQAAIAESPTGVDGLASAVLDLIARETGRTLLDRLGRGRHPVDVLEDIAHDIAKAEGLQVDKQSFAEARAFCDAPAGNPPEAYDPARPGVDPCDLSRDEFVRDATPQDGVPPFSVGQVYEQTPATPLACARCGGVEFHVAEGSCFTAIRCVRCWWECCIHDG